MANLILPYQDEDGEIILQLRTLREQFQTGTISKAEYDAAYQAINRSVGTLCGCERDTVAIQIPGGPALCAACWETRR